MVTPTNNPLGYLGIDSPNPRNTFYRRRAPTPNDFRAYSLGDRWIDTVSDDAYILVDKSNNIATWASMAGVPGTISQFTTQGGGPVLPVAGNINIVGNSGIFTSFSPGTISIDNRRDLTPFVVATSGSEYSTIQAAINAANIVGGGNVMIQPGTYFENLILQPFVNLIGLGSAPSSYFVNVIGSHIVAFAGNSNIIGVNFSSGGDCFTFGAGNPNVNFFYSSVSGNRALVMLNAGGGSVDSEYSSFNGTLSAADIGDNNRIDASTCGFVSGINTFRMSLTGILRLNYCFIQGQVLMNDTSSLVARWARFASVNENLDLVDAGTSAQCISCEMRSTAASTNFATGLGGLSYADLYLSGTATNIAGTVVQTLIPVI